MRWRTRLIAGAAVGALTLALVSGLCGVTGIASPAGAAVTAGAVQTAASPDSGLSVRDLEVDGAATPLGDDDATPSFSWKLDSSSQNARQSAYQIVVGTDRVGLLDGGGRLWDSAKVTTSDSVGISYAGPALERTTRYYWAVRVWDASGQASAWSAPTWWETGLLGSDWDGADWIAPDEASTNTWQDFELDTDFTIKNVAATILLRAKDSSNFYMWQISTATNPGHVMLRPHVAVNGSYSHAGDDVDLAPYLTPDNMAQQHHLRIRVQGDTFTTFIDGHQVDQRTNGALAGAGTIGFRNSSTDGKNEDALFDNLTVSDQEGNVLFSDDFSTSPDPVFPSLPITDGQLEPGQGVFIMSSGSDSPLLRDDFVLSKPITSARAYVYGLGLYELHLNGGKVGDQVLAPTAGQYDTHLFYDTYDITDQLHQGENAVGLWLGSGYDGGYNGYAFRYLGQKKAKMLIAVTYADGTQATVTTSDDWTSSTSPIVANDMYDGEIYNATREQDGWDAPGFDDSNWEPVLETGAPTDGTLVANPAPPRRVVQTITPSAVTNPKPGVFVFDLGQNIAGWARLKVDGPRGTTVTMRTAEEIDSDGLLNGFTNRNAKATDTYTLRGDGQESYEPRFTYHGFRYVEVTGYPGTPTLDDLQGRAVHADLESTGTFSSSDQLLNQIWENNRWAILNNSMSTPTDTPVRDERTPPAMDVQAYRDASVREFDMDRFYAKYLMDLPAGTGLPQDASKAQYPDMAGGQASLPWSLYEQYGDRDTLAANYPLMKAFVERNESDNPSLVWTDNTGLGDWCPPIHNGDVNGGMGSPGAGDCGSESLLVNGALWFKQESDVAAAARALGHDDDAARFTEVADKIKDAFNAKFLNARGDTYGDGRMTTSVLPLAFGMVPDANRDAVGDQLVRTILDANGGHLDTGIFGTRYLMDALAEIGRIDVAMTVLDQTSYPSFGYQIANGATTPWEQWTYNAGMITHDHAMFAGISASLYTQLGGISPTSAGYATSTIAPEVPESLSSVTVSQDTVHGTIGSEWTKSSSQFSLTVTVPANTSARVEVPTFGNPAASVAATPGAERAGSTADGRAVFEVGSGTYRFTAPTRATVVVTVAPQVTGAAKVGQNLAADPGSWSPLPSKVTYQWLRDGAAIQGATSSSYHLVAADRGAALSVQVTAFADGFEDGTATSEPVTIGAGTLLPTALPSIGGTAKVGSRLSATAGAWPAGTTVAFQWNRNGKAIGSATGPGYTPRAEDVRAAVSVTVTAKLPGYDTATAQSHAVTVARGTFAIKHRPKVAGQAKVGRKLRAKAQVFTPRPATITFQWLRNGNAIRGATHATYHVTRKDAGRRITVTVTARGPGFQDHQVRAAAVRVQKRR